MIPGSGPERLSDAGEVGTSGRTGLGGQCSSRVLVTMQVHPMHTQTHWSQVPPFPPRLLDSSPSSQAHSHPALRGHQNALVEGYLVSLLHHHPRRCEAQVDSSQAS